MGLALAAFMLPIRAIQGLFAMIVLGVLAYGNFLPSSDTVKLLRLRSCQQLGLVVVTFPDQFSNLYRGLDDPRAHIPDHRACKIPDRCA